MGLTETDLTYDKAMATETIARAQICPLAECGEDIQPAILADLYVRTKRDGLLDLVFPGKGSTDFAEFIRNVCGRDSLFVLGTVDGETPPAIGYGWLFETNGEKPEASATLGFCFFKESWGRPEVMELAQQAILFWLNQGYRVLYGISLASNALARGFARRAGCQELTILPHYFNQGGTLVPAIMWCIERDEFLEAQQEAEE